MERSCCGSKGARGGRWNGVKPLLEEEDASMGEGEAMDSPVPTTPIVLGTPSSCMEKPVSGLSPPPHRMNREMDGERSGAPGQNFDEHK